MIHLYNLNARLRKEKSDACITTRIQVFEMQFYTPYYLTYKLDPYSNSLKRVLLFLRGLTYVNIILTLILILIKR